MMWPFYTLNLQILKATGNSDKFLILEVVKKAVLIIALLCTFKFGVLAMTWGLIISGFISIIINGWYSGCLIKYSWWQQIFDVFPLLLCSCISACLSFLAGRFFNSSICNLAVSFICFALSFGILTIWFKIIPDELIQLVNDFFSKLFNRKKDADYWWFYEVFALVCTG